MRATSVRGRRLVFWIAGAGLWGGFAGLAAAQDADSSSPGTGTFSERIEVELVDVDVWVADREGRAVTGLGPADFEVLHDGRPVSLSHFTEVRAGAPFRRQAREEEGQVEPVLGGTPGEPAGDIPSHVVAYFDQSRLHPTNYPPLIRGLEEFLDTEGVDPERVLILRQDRSLFIEASFGSTRRELDAALRRLAKATPSGAELEAETELALEAIRRSWEANQDTASGASAGVASIPRTTPGGSPTGAPSGGPRAAVGGVGTGGGSDVCGSFLGQIQPVLSSWARSRGARAAVTLSNLSDIASFLAGLPGVKTLLYLSDGLDTNPGAALASYAAGFCPSGSTQLMSSARFEEMTPRFLKLTRHANTNRVTVYSLQATGLRTSRAASAASGRRARGGGARSGGSFEQSQRSNDRRGLELIARETGGRAVFNQNEFGPELRNIAREARTYYSLAYQPPDDGEAREHRIEVRLSDESLTARYRRGYLEKDSTQWLSERIEGALNLGLTDNPLEIRLGAGEVVPTSKGSFRVPLHVMVPAQRLAFLPRQGATVAEVIVRVMARAIDSSALTVFDKSFLVKGAPGTTGIASLAIELELSGGSHLTAVGVRDAGSGQASFVSTTLQIGSGG